jgi:quercetin dioxygenase-like cupin family protein
MRILRSRKGVIVAAVVVPAALVASSLALATHRPAAGLLFDGTTANDGKFKFESDDGEFELETKGSVRLRHAHVVLGPSVSGWHTHPGPEILAVAEGSITITEADCDQVTIGPGQAYIAPPESPFNVTFASGTDFTATHLLPIGALFSSPAAPRC